MDSNTINNHSIKATLRSIKGKEATLVLEDGQTIIWPFELLPKNTKIGSCVFLNLDTEKTQEEKQKNLARALLNEILES